MSHKYIDIASTYTGMLCRLYTLDGIKQATVSGILNEVATIRTLDGENSMQVCWPVVERKMTTDKLFYSC